LKTFPGSFRRPSKNFIDTVVFRSGDAASGWVYAALKSLGLGLAGLAAAAVPGVILWLLLGLWLGRQHVRKSAACGCPDQRN
jgi:AAA family ATP:ADP antiporter